MSANRLMEVVLEGKEPPACDDTLAIEVVTASDGCARALWQPDERFVNGVGVVMGGYVSSAADVAMAYAISSLLTSSQTFGSINLNVTFHRPVFPGEVTVEAKVEKVGKTVCYLTATMMQKDKLVASATSSVMVREMG